MSERNQNWKLKWIGAKDQNDALKAELIRCYKMIATVAIDGYCDSVEKQFLAGLCEQSLPLPVTPS